MLDTLTVALVSVPVAYWIPAFAGMTVSLRANSDIAIYQAIDLSEADRRRSVQ